jgi:hypothetical protein
LGCSHATTSDKMRFKIKSTSTRERTALKRLQTQCARLRQSVPGKPQRFQRVDKRFPAAAES